MRRQLFAIALACLGLLSCDEFDFPGMVAGSSPASNERFAVSKAYNDAHGSAYFGIEGSEYTFYAATDAHVSTTADGLSRFVYDYYTDDAAAPFALFLGDAMDKKNNFGRFLTTVNPIATRGRTLFCTPGNHDLYFGQWTDYIKEMKTASYCFTVNNVLVNTTDLSDLYICLDSASGTLGTDQKAWLEDVLAKAKGHHRHIIVFTHTHFFKRDNSQGHTSNFNLEEGHYLANLFSENGVDLVLSGHDHFFEDTWFKNVHFVTLTAITDKMEEKCYYTFKVTDKDITVTSHPADKAPGASEQWPVY